MPTPSTRPAYSEWGLKTTVDDENGQFVITVPFAPDDLPFYPVLVAALIAGRSATSMYNAVTRNLYGIAEQAAEIEGVLHIHHDSLVGYLATRDASAQEIIARKKATLERIAKRKTRPRLRPRAPIPVTASPTAAQMLAAGTLDFLDTLPGIGDED